MKTPLATAQRSSRKMAARRGSSSLMLRWAWLASMCQSPFLFLTTVSADGSLLCLAICTCMGRRACSSTRVRRWLPAAGPIRARAKLILDSPRCDSARRLCHASGVNHEDKWNLTAYYHNRRVKEVAGNLAVGSYGVRFEPMRMRLPEITFPRMLAVDV